MSDVIHTTTTAPLPSYEREILAVRRRLAIAALLAAIAAVIAAIVLLLWLLWLITATPKATAFDADGVRCYRAATELSCIKTAEPAR